MSDQRSWHNAWPNAGRTVSAKQKGTYSGTRGGPTRSRGTARRQAPDLLPRGGTVAACVRRRRPLQRRVASTGQGRGPRPRPEGTARTTGTPPAPTRRRRNRRRRPPHFLHPSMIMTIRPLRLLGAAPRPARRGSPARPHTRRAGPPPHRAAGPLLLLLLTARSERSKWPRWCRAAFGPGLGCPGCCCCCLGCLARLPAAPGLGLCRV